MNSQHQTWFTGHKVVLALRAITVGILMLTNVACASDGEKPIPQCLPSETTIAVTQEINAAGYYHSIWLGSDGMLERAEHGRNQLQQLANVQLPPQRAEELRELASAAVKLSNAESRRSASKLRDDVAYEQGWTSVAVNDSQGCHTEYIPPGVKPSEGWDDLLTALEAAFVGAASKPPSACHYLLASALLSSAPDSLSSNWFAPLIAKQPGIPVINATSTQQPQSAPIEAVQAAIAQSGRMQAVDKKLQYNHFYTFSNSQLYLIRAFENQSCAD